MGSSAAELEAKIRTMLPSLYRESYEELRPAPMRSAALKYDNEGRVAWGDIWGSFCDLAMAGGPPHRGTLLEPGTPNNIAKQELKYQAVTAEICRGLHLVTGLYARPSPIPGWVRLDCTSAAMAAWLCRAILMENVSARADGLGLGLPSGPDYRVEKETKNVIVAAAKTCHYWQEHMSEEQHVAIGMLLREMDAESAFQQPQWDAERPAASEHDGFAGRLAEAIEEAIEKRTLVDSSGMWVGVDCADLPEAVAATRLIFVQNCAVHREDATLFVPINRTTDPNGARVVGAVSRAFAGTRSKA